ncbi:MAG: hypothetical protein R3C30_15450 [Hyphomonadaceae bacterium]
MTPALQVEDYAGGKRLRTDASRQEVLRLLQTDEPFVDAFSATLAAAPYAGIFWETPPLTADRLASSFECMVIPSDAVGRLVADARPFSEMIDAGRGTHEVVARTNLGGDAELIVPCDSGEGAYAHLVSFLRTAPRGQIRTLWRKTGEVAERWMQASPQRPLWISTSGLGVSWLHVRIDARPKYYSHGPYRSLS